MDSQEAFWFRKICDGSRTDPMVRAPFWRETDLRKNSSPETWWRKLWMIERQTENYKKGWISLSILSTWDANHQSNHRRAATLEETKAKFLYLNHPTPAKEPLAKEMFKNFALKRSGFTREAALRLTHTPSKDHQREPWRTTPTYPIQLHK